MNIDVVDLTSHQVDISALGLGKTPDESPDITVNAGPLTAIGDTNGTPTSSNDVCSPGYRIPNSTLSDCLTSVHLGRRKYWSHKLYVGPSGCNVKVHYCRNRTESELIARQLLEERVLGFDMEWECSRVSKSIKHNVSLIQLASENCIALFHIALHEGSTPRELLAPSLRKILESDKILKTGVAIFNADGRRLKQHMKLKPEGLVELSHLHGLVRYLESCPNINPNELGPHKVTKRLVGLSAQVEEYLGFPLWKGRVRKSHWSKKLNQNQIDYAASDAYAGYMLWKVMEAKRLTCYNRYVRLQREQDLHVKSIKLPENKHSEASISSMEPRPALAAIENNAVVSPTVATSTSGSDRRSLPWSTNNAQSQIDKDAHETCLPSSEADRKTRQVYSALNALRIRLARLAELPCSEVASDQTLSTLVNLRPSDERALVNVEGAGHFVQLACGNGIALHDFILKYTPANVSGR